MSAAKSTGTTATSSIGTTRSLVVHHNHLKLCYGEPQPLKEPQLSSQTNTREPHSAEPTGQPALPVVTGGYTSSANEDATVPAEGVSGAATWRPHRASRPPPCYNDFIRTDDEDITY